jgi:penicillin-binding protein 1B
MPTRQSGRRPPAPRSRRSRSRPPRRRWKRYVAVALAGPLLVLSAAAGVVFVNYSRLLDERLQGIAARSGPRILGRPLQLHRNQALTERQLVDRLNDLGYVQRTRVEQPGAFAPADRSIALMARSGEFRGRVVRVIFRTERSRDAAGAFERIDRLEIAGGERVDSLMLDPPLLTSLAPDGREKRRTVSLAGVPRHLVQAVLAIEDRRFYDHPGVDPIRAIGALVTNLRGDRPYLVGASTITQQLVKNFFLTPEKTLKRKLQEQFLALIVDQRLSKDEILELYLNEVYLGHRSSFAIHGVAEGARLFFGKDVGNVSLVEAATMAGVIQSPQVHSPFRHPARARAHRDVVIRVMHEAGFISAEAAQRAFEEPLTIVSRAVDAEAPFFVDWITRSLEEQHPGLVRSRQAVDVHTTLDLHLQRLADESVRQGLARVDEILARSSRRRPRVAQAALVALDPRTGEVLALVGGRAYQSSHYNRAINARRQPGSVFKPFVFLTAFERAAAEGRTDLTPATVVVDEPTTFSHEQTVYSPNNYRDEYDGPITFRRALALSRNVATVKVAEAAGYEAVAALWRRMGARTPPRPYPSIALGVFEATPLEIAAAYTLFPNLGEMRQPFGLARLMQGDKEIGRGPDRAPIRIARPETTFLVLNMMRSVLSDGTGAPARAAGFRFDAAGKSGTTNGLRDAWFAGFTPELLTVVWVGCDDNQALGLSGTQAALPIWTAFMARALAGRRDVPFTAPRGIAFVEIDPQSGTVAVPGCPTSLREAFADGTQPLSECPLHRFGPAAAR